jgi:hypothetical protein
MLDRIKQFFISINQKPIELYSEFGVQHELAIFLRSKYDDIKVMLEYPVTRIFNPLPDLVKKEMDIYVTNQEGQKFVIELKMPKGDCGTPNEMYRALQDIKFLEQLKQNHIDGCYALLITERQAFWQAAQANAGIYRRFNGQSVNLQTVDITHLPHFLHKKGAVTLANTHQGQWQNYTDINGTNWKYYLLDIL